MVDERRLLVHQSADIDDRRTVGFLDRIGDFDVFVMQATRWLERHPG